MTTAELKDRLAFLMGWVHYPTHKSYTETKGTT